MKKIQSIFTAGMMMSLPLMAEETTIDPSDLTQVYTQAAVFVTSDADIRFSSMLTGAWSENTQFGGFLEAEVGAKENDDKDAFGANYKRSRAQYFQVSAINSTTIPRAGFMVDAIHQNTSTLTGLPFEDTTLFSVGAIGLINPAYTGGTMLFPNVNYTAGNVMGESAQGYMLNLFATVPLGDAGSFMQVWPEYMSVAGDVVEMESLAFNAMFNAPLTKDRTQWLMTKLQYATSDVTLPNGQSHEGDYQLKAEIGIKWFF
jgi:hypothetical protein